MTSVYFHRPVSGAGRARAIPGALVAATLVWLGGCAANPVTGEQELQLISEGTEVQIGQQNYLPAQQSQGGPYILDPDLTTYLRGVGERLVEVSDRSGLPYEFALLNDSTPNAWAMPGGKIAVNRGLLVELDSEAELAAVLGHEIVHAAARHGAKGMERNILLQVGVAALGVAAAGTDYGDLVQGAGALGAALINQKYSREQELEADEYGMNYMARTGYDPKAAVSLQETFVRLYDKKEPGWLAGLFASHPPSRERVDANRRHAQELPPGGDVGRETYRRYTERLRRTRPAYDKYDKAREVFAKGESAPALVLVNEAIAIEPGEALFHGLAGDILRKQGRLKAARSAYDEAIGHNDGYYRLFLGRGLLAGQMGDEERARADLQRSVELLPTATAHTALGELYLQGGQKSLAVREFEQAAGTDSPAGKQARERLARLRPPSDLARSLQATTARDRNGYIVVRVLNRAKVTVTDVAVELTLHDKSGGTLSRQMLRSSGSLPPGAAGILTSRFRVTSREARQIDARARVVSAGLQR